MENYLHLYLHCNTILTKTHKPQKGGRAGRNDHAAAKAKKPLVNRPQGKLQAIKVVPQITYATGGDC